MTISKDKIRMSLIIKKDLKEKIEKEAKKDNRSVNNLINTVLMEYLNKKKEGK
ncbi:DNA-binding protein [Clostridium sp. 2218st1_F5_2218SCRN_220325]|uniref:DNA-binding protein n=1 Tax=Clostridium sp. 2218st1_F5_2218SCRN_220325 TaxID=3143056 RepID=UPI00319DB4D0